MCGGGSLGRNFSRTARPWHGLPVRPAPPALWSASS